MKSRPRGTRASIAFWALAGVALLASHDAIFLVQLGPGEALARALRSAGHAYWSAASAGLVAVATLFAVATAVRLIRLRGEARRLRRRAPIDTPSLGTPILVTWGRLFAIVAVGFVIQESLEHLAMHGHAIGLGALLGPEYPLALPVLAAITLLAALVAALVGGAEAALLTTIADARRAVPRAPRRIARAPLRLRPSTFEIAARAIVGRAPPLVLAPV